MTIAKKLALAFGALGTLVLLVAMLALHGLSAAREDFVQFVNGIDTRALLAAGVRTGVDQRAIAARNLVIVVDPTQIQVERKAVYQAHQDVQDRLKQLHRLLDKPGVSERERKLAANFDAVESQYGPVALDIVQLALAGRTQEASVKIEKVCRPLLVQLSQAAEEYASYTASSAVRLQEEAATKYNRNRAILIGACAAAFLTAVAAGLAITRSLRLDLGAEPSALNQAAQRVAEGDLVLSGSAEPLKGSVMAALSAMRQSLASIVVEVRNCSDSIATGAAQIATGNADLSQRTEEQASALQQTSATMDELGTTVQHNAAHAKQASNLAQNASEIAIRGGAVVGEVVKTMGVINESSRKISEIIGTVDSIAFQTNILALNAAVEAARAGEQGRGFAVVASEVRNLAQRSADAAKEIKQLIGSSVSQVHEGTQLVDRAGSTMREVVDAITQVTAIVREISSASTEQSIGVGQVAEAITQIDQVTQQNAALVEESAAAAASLQQQAKHLVVAVSAFMIDAMTGHTPLDSAPSFPSATRAQIANRLT